MSIEYKVLHYSAQDKMSELICDKYHMILVLNRFGIDMGFSDMTISEVCDKYGIDTYTFLCVVNLLANKETKIMNPEKISLSTIVYYLKNSHTYFRDFKLPEIKEKLMASLSENNAVSLAVINYYDEYIAEVVNHMDEEESSVFSHVDKIESGQANDFNIDSFEQHHQSVESKLAELKNIIVKYYHTKSTHELSSVLFDIFTCEKDLSSHSDIEDYLLIPAIKAKQNK